MADDTSPMPAPPTEGLLSLFADAHAKIDAKSASASSVESAMATSTPTPAGTTTPAVAAPAHGTVPLVRLTIDERLLHAIFQVGPSPAGFFRARNRGIRAEHLFPEAAPVYALMEQFAPKGRLPSLGEIQLKTGLKIDRVVAEPYDVDLVSEEIVNRALTTQLMSKLRPLAVSDKLLKSPVEVRNELHQIWAGLAWSYGEPYSINSRAAITELRDRYIKREEKGDGVAGLSSPWPTMDRASDGLQPGELTVLFAKRKIGKSWAAIAWATHIWRNDIRPGEKLLFVTMEMTRLQVLQRMAAIDLKLSYNDFRNAKLTPEDKARFEAWCACRMDALRSDPDLIFADSNSVRTVQDLSALVGEHRPKGVIVDSFYILGRASGKSLHERVLTNVQELKLDIAIQHHVPVLASTQLKGTTSKDVLDADSDDAMGAKAIGDYADATRLLAANKKYLDANQRVWRSMEAREFIGKDLVINFNLDKMDFSEDGEYDEARQEADKKEAEEEEASEEEEEDRAWKRKGGRKSSGGSSGGGGGRRRRDDDDDAGSGPVPRDDGREISI